MSYCRWSSDDYQSDLYVYGDEDGGYVSYVAGRRYVLAEPLPPPVELGESIESRDAWVERHRKVQEIIKRSKNEVIDLPERGARFFHETAGECADNLERLRSLGYHVPQEAIDRLREEQDETCRCSEDGGRDDDGTQ